MADPTTQTEPVPTESTVAPQAPPTTVIGPNGTAPGMSFVEQQEQPMLDARTGRAAGAPLAVAAVLLLVIFTVIFLRAARARRRPPRAESGISSDEAGRADAGSRGTATRS